MMHQPDPPPPPSDSLPDEPPSPPEGPNRSDRAQQGFSDDLVTDLVDLAGLAASSRVLEIGCGTGRLSVPLARHGIQLLALELSPEAAAVARRRLAAFPDAEVAVTAFERWRSTESFDALVCTSTFATLNPETRLNLCANRLRLPGAGHAGGALAVVDTRPVEGQDEEILRELRECFGRWAPSVRRRPTPPPIDELPAAHPELSAARRFSRHLHTRRYVWEHSTTAAELLDLLRLSAGPAVPAGPVPPWLRACFETVVAHRGTGKVTQRYATDLQMTTRAR
jgi:SAM-dependent methyltransferase